MSMNLAGDYARACHERIYLNLAKALGLKPLANVNNHHNFAWKEEIIPGRMSIVHRKGATPAQKGQAGLIPGSMTTPGYLVCGKGVEEALIRLLMEPAGQCPAKRQKIVYAISFEEVTVASWSNFDWWERGRNAVGIQGH